MSKAPKHSLYCMNCKWELKNTQKHTDGWKCPKCGGPVISEERR
ncbi:hypothetical protein [Virgibacillus phage Mimir87]|nr:hypothetical protein [Virgibacillus phage Mimir87]